FQQSRGLTVVGIVDLATWTSLAVVPPSRPGIPVPAPPCSTRTLNRSFLNPLCTPRPHPQFQPPTEATFFQPRFVNEPGPSVQSGERRLGGIPVNVQNQRLTDMGIEVVPLASIDCGGTQGYPNGFDPTNVLNYLEIADAFSHIPYATIWTPLGISSPFPDDVYYDNLFKRISNPFQVVVARSGLASVGCGGDTGQ